jgi:hypothetical protein
LLEYIEKNKRKNLPLIIYYKNDYKSRTIYNYYVNWKYLVVKWKKFPYKYLLNEINDYG